MAVGSQEVTLRSRFGRVLTVLVVAICVATEVGAVSTGDAQTALRATAPLALLAFGMYALFWAPYVRVGPAAVEFGNPLRTVIVTWPAIENVETRWALTLVLADRKFSAWASPAQNRYSAVSRQRRDIFGRPDFAAERAASGRREDAPITVSGLAPLLVAQQWRQYRESGLLHGLEGAGYTERWNRATLVIFVVLAAASVVAAL